MKNKAFDELKVIRGFSIPDLRAKQQENNNKTRSVEGHAAVFDQVVDIGGYFDEVIERGAFNGCDFSDVLMCVNHDTRKIPLARSRNNSPTSTLRLSIDEQGLAISADLDVDNNPEARTVISAIERGDLDGMSFIFQIQEQKWERMDTDKPLRRVVKVARVYEVGPVNCPAYSNTDIYARDKQVLESAKLELESARSNELESSSSAEVLKLRNQILSK